MGLVFGVDYCWFVGNVVVGVEGLDCSYGGVEEVVVDFFVGYLKAVVICFCGDCFYVVELLVVEFLIW